jgi:hypothetical protein
MCYGKRRRRRNVGGRGRKVKRWSRDVTPIKHFPPLQELEGSFVDHVLVETGDGLLGIQDGGTSNGRWLDPLWVRATHDEKQEVERVHKERISSGEHGLLVDFLNG